jgi:hypothetical protein
MEGITIWSTVRSNQRGCFGQSIFLRARVRAVGQQEPKPPLPPASENFRRGRGRRREGRVKGGSNMMCARVGSICSAVPPVECEWRAGWVQERCGPAHARPPSDIPTPPLITCA